MPTEKELGTESAAILRMKQSLSKLESVDGRLKGLAYKPRPDEVAITTTPKAGTTWMQQIVHQLRTGGDMSFEEISDVVPWIELAADQGIDLEAPQSGSIRCFKTHCWAQHCPPFAKTIVVVRDPYDVAYSFYRFFEDWFFAPGEITLDSFVDEFWLTRDSPGSKTENASYFVHLNSWYERRHEAGVMFVFFEDMKEDLRHEVQRVARFISTDEHNFDKEELIDLVTNYATFEYMKEHEAKFRDVHLKRTRNEDCGLPKDDWEGSTGDIIACERGYRSTMGGQSVPRDWLCHL
jgi:Sulfotransferase domain